MRLALQFVTFAATLASGLSFHHNVGTLAGCGRWDHLLRAKLPPIQHSLHKNALFSTGNDFSFSAAASAESVETEPWTKPRLHNTKWFRSVSILSALFLAGAFDKSPLSFLSTKATSLIHLLSFSVFFGTSFYTTFIAGITMFQNLPRQTFGKLQAKLFPKYFSLCSISILLQLLTLRSLSSRIPSSATVALGCAMAMTLLNQLFLEPQSTTIMLERHDLENSGETDSKRYKELKASFGKLHGMSSLANLIALCAGVVHAVALASLLAL